MLTEDLWLCRPAMAQDASASVHVQTGSAPQINGVTPQIGHLQGQAAPSKAQKADSYEKAAPLQDGIQLQSHDRIQLQSH